MFSHMLIIDISAHNTRKHALAFFQQSIYILVLLVEHLWQTPQM